MTLPFRALVPLAGLIVVALPSPAAATLPPGTVRLIDRPSNGLPLPLDASNYSITGSARALSSDGRFAAFESDSDALVAATFGSLRHRYVYVRDRQTNTIENVCRSTAGAAGDAGCSSAAISPNGRYVAFLSSSDNLGGPVPSLGVYVHDRQSGTTTLMNRETGLNGAADTGYPSQPAVADNGTVVFATSGELVPAVDDGNARTDIYTRTLAGVTNVHSQSAGVIGNAPSFAPDISGNGSVVAFASSASNLSAADANTRPDVYTTPVGGGAPSLKSRLGAAGAVGDGSSQEPSLSQDGSKIAFSTSSTNLFGFADANGTSDVVLRNNATGANTAISVVDGSATSLLPGGGSRPRVSANGDVVVFLARQSGVDATALRRVATNATLNVSRRPGSDGAVVDGSPAGVSADGNIVMFGSGELDPGAVHEQVWARDVAAGANDRLSRAAADDVPAQVHYGSLGDTSADGRFTVFQVRGVGLGGPADSVTHIYLRDEREGTTHQLDRVGGIGGTPAGVAAEDPRISDDGSVVVFQGYGSGLAPGDEAGGAHAYVWRRSTNAVSVASMSPSGAPVATAPEAGVDISADGSAVAFVAEENFLPGDASGAIEDVFVRDLRTGTVHLATRATNGGPSTADARQPRLDQDGSVVAFSTFAALDPAADANALSDVYVHDVAANATELISRQDGAGTSAGNKSANLDGISADGGRVVFSTSASDLGDGVTSSFGDVHLRERAAQRTIWVSRTADGSQNNAASYSGAISADGRTVAFESSSTKLVVPAASGASPALYVRALDASSTTMVVPGPAQSTMFSYNAQLSANGQCVAFTTPDPSVLAGGYSSPDFQHVYLKALGDQCLLADPPAPTPSPAPAPGDQTRPVLSALKASRTTITRSGKRRSTRLSFTASERVVVRLEVARLTAGKRKGKQCRKPSAVKGRAKTCVYEGKPQLVRTAELAGGRRTLSFNGKVRGKRLRPGRYRLVLTATDAAGNATAKRLTVDIRIA